MKVFKFVMHQNNNNWLRGPELRLLITIETSAERPKPILNVPLKTIGNYVKKYLYLFRDFIYMSIIMLFQTQRHCYFPFLLNNKNSLPQLLMGVCSKHYIQFNIPQLHTVISLLIWFFSSGTCNQLDRHLLNKYSSL